MIIDWIKSLFHKKPDEIVKLKEPKELFGQADKRIEITAECLQAREGLFDGS